jgi:hypothetical protein
MHLGYGTRPARISQRARPPACPSFVPLTRKNIVPRPPVPAATERARRWLRLELEALTLIAYLLTKRGRPTSFEEAPLRHLRRQGKRAAAAAAKAAAAAAAAGGGCGGGSSGGAGPGAAAGPSSGGGGERPSNGGGGEAGQSSSGGGGRGGADTNGDVGALEAALVEVSWEPFNNPRPFIYVGAPHHSN